MTLLCLFQFHTHDVSATHDHITVKSNWDADEEDKMPDDVVMANMGSV
jgi:hypothetical protein